MIHGAGFEARRIVRAGAAGSWRTMFAPLSSLTTAVGGWSGYTSRHRMAAAEVLVSGSKIRLTLKAPSSNGMVIGKAYVQHISGTYGFAAAPTPITFSSGSTTATVAANGTIVTDEITFALDKTKDLIVSFYWSGTTDFATCAAGDSNGVRTFYKLGDDAINQSPTGYATTAYQAVINLGEAFG